MKKTCNRCKAFSDNGKPYNGKCTLGYKIAKTNTGLLSFDFKPCEECPKPLTNMQLINERTK